MLKHSIHPDYEQIHQKQRVKRRHRIREQTLTMKNKFNARWIIRRAELVAAAKKEAQSYLDDPRNTFEIRRNIAELKKNFWEPPLPENQSREKIIASPFNVTFLFLEAKLKVL